MIITPREIIDIIIMVVFLGFLFKDIFKRPKHADYDPLRDFKKLGWRNFKYAIYVTGPAVIFHELAHKFVAMAFGAQATFFAFYNNTFSLILAVLAIIMKLAGSGFMLFIPGYVVHSGGPSFLANSVISFAGPGLNLALWLISWKLLKSNINQKYVPILHMTKQINMFLFIFNMLPIPPFDGYSVYSNLIRAVF